MLCPLELSSVAVRSVTYFTMAVGTKCFAVLSLSEFNLIEGRLKLSSHKMYICSLSNERKDAFPCGHFLVI